MSFLETPRFPEDISIGARGGPSYNTNVNIIRSGHEQRSARWTKSRAKYDVSYGVRTEDQLEELLEHFHAVLGKEYGFRYKDWGDFKVKTSAGLLGTGLGTGLPTYQLNKKYVRGALSTIREIQKPVEDSETIYRNAVAVVSGIGAGQYSLDTTTGIVTFVADGSSNASSITVGATTQVVLAANLGLTAGKLLYLTGFTGTHASLINDIAHTINSVSGTGPYTFTLATNTAGKTITLGTGKGKKYPQVSDVLIWEGEFDVPVRFDTDEMQYEIISKNGEDGEILISWQGVPVIEIRV